MNLQMLSHFFKVSVLFGTIMAGFLNLNAQQVEPISFAAKRIEFRDSVSSFEVSITGGSPGYKVYVLDKPFGQNGRIILEAEKLSEKKFKIVDISLSSFFICVEDQDKNFVCKRNDKLRR